MKGHTLAAALVLAVPGARTSAAAADAGGAAQSTVGSRGGQAAARSNRAIKSCRNGAAFKRFEPLDAVRNHPFPGRNQLRAMYHPSACVQRCLDFLPAVILLREAHSLTAPEIAELL
jgi:hypothetical protein